MTYSVVKVKDSGAKGSSCYVGFFTGILSDNDLNIKLNDKIIKNTPL